MLMQLGMASSVCAYAQSTTLDKLTGTAWKIQLPNGIKSGGYDDYAETFRYNTTNRTRTIYAQKRDFSYYQPFYLSNTVEASFDDSQVGKNRNGKYLIVKEYPSDGIGRLSVFEIVRLNAEELVMKSLRNNVVLVYVAV